jgi:hypothetical protein
MPLSTVLMGSVVSNFRARSAGPGSFDGSTLATAFFARSIWDLKLEFSYLGLRFMIWSKGLCFLMLETYGCKEGS